MINGTDEPLELDMARYAEILPAGSKMHRSLGGEDVEIADTLTLEPRQTLVLQNF